jgi:hypothetical protein
MRSISFVPIDLFAWDPCRHSLGDGQTGGTHSAFARKIHSWEPEGLSLDKARDDVPVANCLGYGAGVAEPKIAHATRLK